MSKLFKASKFLRPFKKDERGGMSVMFGVSIAVLAMGIGIAFDSSQYFVAKHRAQSVADSVGLSAAVFIKNNERKPSNAEEGYVHNHNYDIQAAGYRMTGMVKGATVKVKYNDELRQAEVTVTGQTDTAFMKVAGVDEVEFEATSIVKYHEVDLKDPATILLVLDNSGSMAFDDKPIVPTQDGALYVDIPGAAPDDAQPRIDGLRTSVKGFMTRLSNVVDSSAASGNRVIRTGIYAFNSDIIDSQSVPPKWGLLTNADIEKMVPTGGTNSSPPMTAAWNSMKGENAVHAAEHGDATPLRFVIFMTDGMNDGSKQWFNKEGTGIWKGETSTDTWIDTSHWEDQEVEVDEEVTIPAYYNWTTDGSRFDTVRYNGGTYAIGCRPWLNETERCDDVNNRRYQYNEETTEIQTVTRIRPVWVESQELQQVWEEAYEYDSEQMPTFGRNWVEGIEEIPNTFYTKETCEEMHEEYSDNTVKVYTIGYALDEGLYETGNWGWNADTRRYPLFDTKDEATQSGWNEGTSLEAMPERKAAAYSLLRFCASTQQNFILADDADELEEAFDRIGHDIEQEIIRIAS